MSKKIVLVLIAIIVLLVGFTFLAPTSFLF